VQTSPRTGRDAPTPRELLSLRSRGSKQASTQGWRRSPFPPILLRCEEEEGEEEEEEVEEAEEEEEVFHTT
jgi:hypothetical protein